MSLGGLAGLSNAVGSAEGLKRVAAFFHFVRKRYGIEKKGLTEAETANIVSTLGLKDASAAVQCCESSWVLIEEVDVDFFFCSFFCFGFLFFGFSSCAYLSPRSQR
jgi:hypothetical protein